MKPKFRVAVVPLVALVALAAVLMNGQVQGARPPADVPLVASFRSMVDSVYQPDAPEHYVDKLLNDDPDVPYVSDNGEGVSVYFTGDVGDLHFRIEHHSARNVRVIFPELWNDTVGWLPDTAGIYPALPDEPVDFFKLRTYNSSAFGDLRVNFLTMTAGQTASVRLWTTICTSERHYYYMNYSHDIGKISGLVQVTASGNTGKNGAADTWVVEPIPETDVAQVWKQSETGKNVFYPFGAAPMPFSLTLKIRK